MNRRDALKFGAAAWLFLSSGAAAIAQALKLKMTTAIPRVAITRRTRSKHGSVRSSSTMAFPTRLPSRRSTITSISSAACRHTLLHCPPFRLRVS